VATGLSLDSRKVRSGDLFVALAGERFDAHAFLPEVSTVAAAVIIQRGKGAAVKPGCACIEVCDPRAALGKLAAAYRRDFPIPVFAVAGSNGKTTTKDILAAVLRVKFPTLASEASFNNDVGVPWTLLQLTGKDRQAVLELGTNHPGELAPLVRMAQPQYGIITNIGAEHLEFFHDLEGVANEEGFLAELLPGAGMLFLNGDTQWSARIAARALATVVLCGLAEGNHWRAHRLRLDGKGVYFTVECPRPEYRGEYRIGIIGRHQAANAVLAVAAAAHLGLTKAEIQAGLEQVKPVKMRLQIWETTGGVRILEDVYNANLDSMRAALETLQSLACKGRRIAVLGDMAELGGASEGMHLEVGREAARSGIGQLFAVGARAGELARGAREAGLSRVLELNEVESAIGAIKGFVKPGDLVLVKASRAARFERISAALRGAEGGMIS
jgi:UDP-N-acetylmuramoyl-tripeptide--D-alanyl-D-alanine ligase